MAVAISTLPCKGLAITSPRYRVLPRLGHLTASEASDAGSNFHAPLQGTCNYISPLSRFIATWTFNRVRGLQSRFNFHAPLLGTCNYNSPLSRFTATWTFNRVRGL
jgi:hypothetical protein